MLAVREARRRRLLETSRRSPPSVVQRARGPRIPRAPLSEGDLHRMEMEQPVVVGDSRMDTPPPPTVLHPVSCEPLGLLTQRTMLTTAPRKERDQICPPPPNPPTPPEASHHLIGRVMFSAPQRPID